MRHVLRFLGKLVLSLLALTAALVLIVGAFFGIEGYNLYRAAVEEKPVEELAASIREQDGFVSYDRLPQIYIDAVVSAEDQRFWTHSGVDFLAIGRALWHDLQTLSFAEGGSTISQQLMKNQYFTQDKTLERKFAEIFAAWKLEKTYTKQEIFEMYVNTIYFGSGYYGIAQAAEGYYGKEPEELTDYEAVMLAGLPNAPSAYALDTNLELARQRMDQVLERMVDCGKLTAAEAAALASP